MPSAMSKGTTYGSTTLERSQTSGLGQRTPTVPKLGVARARSVRDASVRISSPQVTHASALDESVRLGESVRPGLSRMQGMYQLSAIAHAVQPIVGRLCTSGTNDAV
eukprot:gene12200-biopygen3634